jgi:hypothetical protein
MGQSSPDISIACMATTDTADSRVRPEILMCPNLTQHSQPVAVQLISIRSLKEGRTVSWYSAIHTVILLSSRSRLSAGGGNITDLSESSALRTLRPSGKIILATRPEYAQHSSILYGASHQRRTSSHPNRVPRVINKHP